MEYLTPSRTGKKETTAVRDAFQTHFCLLTSSDHSKLLTKFDIFCLDYSIRTRDRIRNPLAWRISTVAAFSQRTKALTGCSVWVI